VSPIERARQVLLDAITARIFPAAVVNIGTSAKELWHEALGALTFAPGAVHTAETTPFDLASLTKVVATTTVVMELLDTGALRLDEPLTGCFPEWQGADRASVSVQDLLEHSSGLPARLIETPPGTRREFEHEICTMPLEYEPRARALYSDLGFILLGMLAADRAGQSLAAAFDSVRRRLATVDAAVADISFRLVRPMKLHAAPTVPMEEDLRRGRLLIGDVHDSYAAALGGVAGHAGLFATAAGIAGFARAALRAARGDTGVPHPFSPSRVLQFVSRSTTVPGSSRALGWDTMLPTSSCGTHMSPTAFGHVGFTGTSLWIDPPRDRYFVLLTNRACEGGTVQQMREVRRTFHDALHDL
jgi:serine-type D-Ala-D-Ala carboxypeptidase